MYPLNKLIHSDKARQRSIVVAMTATLLAISGCSKSHTDDPFQGTWFYDRATSKNPHDWSYIRAMEFKDRKDKGGTIVVTRYAPSEEITTPEDSITGTYTISAPNQITVTLPGRSGEGVMDVAVQPDDTVIVTPKSTSYESPWQMRWLKSDETLASAEKADHDAVIKKESDEKATTRAAGGKH